jgi:hypothetical protein
MPSGLSLISSSVNSTISTAVTVIVAEAGSSCPEVFFFAELLAGFGLPDAAEVVFLSLGGGFFIAPPPPQIGVYRYEVVSSWNIAFICTPSL